MKITEVVEWGQDPVLQEDLERIADAPLSWEEWRNGSFLVTGATGLVGSMLIRALACANRRRNLGLKITGLVRSRRKAQEVFGTLADREDLAWAEADILEPVALDGPVDFILHGASVTASKIFVTQPVETVKTAVLGTMHLLELAREKQVKGMVYLSSMEAFGQADPSLPEVKEADLGKIDLTSVRSCYSESKRMCELLCACYAHEYGLPVKSARLAQTFGAGVARSEGRIFAQFAKSVIHGQDIVLHTRGESYGNYCYTADAVKGILTILSGGEPGQAYTVANPSTAIRIRDMAQMAAEELAEGRIRVVFDIPEDALTYGYAPDVCMRLNSDKLQALGWQPEVGLADMFRRLIASFRVQGEGEKS